MSYALAEFTDGSIEYYEDVSVNWGDLGITLDKKGTKDYYYINPNYLLRLAVEEEPMYFVEPIEEEQEGDDEAE